MPRVWCNVMWRCFLIFHTACSDVRTGLPTRVFKVDTLGCMGVMNLLLTGVLELPSGVLCTSAHRPVVRGLQES